jgi:hypothetical protein
MGNRFADYYNANGEKAGTYTVTTKGIYQKSAGPYRFEFKPR